MECSSLNGTSPSQGFRVVAEEGQKDYKSQAWRVSISKQCDLLSIAVCRTHSGHDYIVKSCARSNHPEFQLGKERGSCSQSPN